MSTETQLVTLTISGVLADLAAGTGRKEIAAKYNLNRANMIELFKHPKLKGARVHPKVEAQFILEDDAPDVVPRVIAPRGSKVKATVTTEAAQPLAANTEGENGQEDDEQLDKGTW